MNERDEERLRGRPGRDRDEALARLLRAADPAADAELDPVDKAELRRAVLDAAARGESPSAWMALGTPWVTAAALTAVLVAGAGLAFLLLGEPPPAGGEAGTDPVATAPPIEPQPEEAASITEATPAETTVSAPTPEAGTSSTSRTTVAAVTSSSALPSPDRASRTLHLTAPRGTRIIWTLDPSFESPIDGQMPRQENAP